MFGVFERIVNSLISFIFLFCILFVQDITESTYRNLCWVNSSNSSINVLFLCFGISIAVIELKKMSFLMKIYVCDLRFHFHIRGEFSVVGEARGGSF